MSVETARGGDGRLPTYEISSHGIPPEYGAARVPVIERQAQLFEVGESSSGNSSTDGFGNLSPDTQLDGRQNQAQTISAYHQRTDSTSSIEEVDAEVVGKGKGKVSEKQFFDRPSVVVHGARDEDLKEEDAAMLIGPIISRTQSTKYYEPITASIEQEVDNAYHRKVGRPSYTAPSSPPSNLNPERDAQQQKSGMAYRFQNFNLGASKWGATSAADVRFNSVQSTAPRPSAKKSSIFTFTMPNFHLPQMPSAPSFLTHKSQQATRKRSKSNVLLSAGTKEQSSSGLSSMRNSMFSMNNPMASSKPSYPERDPVPQELRLQRSCSHPSSMLSFSSSLDNERFASVQSMTNARLKAIKDNFRGLSPGFTIAGAANALSTYANSINSALNSSSTPPSNSDLPTANSACGPGGVGNPPHSIDAIQGDIVVMGGYRGSILREATGQKRRMWIPLRVGLNLRKVNLEVGLNPEDEEAMAERVVPDGMLTHIGPVDIGKRLLKRLRTLETERTEDGLGRQVHEYGYDWRLSPKLLSRQLIEYLEKLPCNKGVDRNSPRQKGKGAFVIAHSLGGLIVRNAINQRPELFSGVIFAGTPQHCVNILGPLRNGDTVLLSSRVLTAQVNFTLRSSYVLLPEEGHCFIDKNTGEKYPLDFFDVKTWIKYGLSPCVATPTPAPPPLLPLPNGSTMAIGTAAGLAHPPHTNSSGATSTSSNSTQLTQPSSFSQNSSPSPPSPPTVQHMTPSSITNTLTTAAKDVMREFHKDRTLAPQMDSSSSHQVPHHTSSPSSSSAPGPASSTMLPSLGGISPFSQPFLDSMQQQQICTLPLSQTVPYLERTLAEIKEFKRQLHYNPDVAASAVGYPPMAVIYASNTPTVKGAKVDGLQGILADGVYDELVFGAGDGVCLAKAAMLPRGYKCAARVVSERGHISLLGDFEAVGKAVEGVLRERGW
ncbi:hypothetical protein DFH27DRAFT_552067 [Peziza echinospora]|nr:hypothetical protein DFH27DRAFT_552067 [Peziza echinospora]